MDKNKAKKVTWPLVGGNTMWEKIRSFATWKTIRTFGELQILTKSSYFMLIFVPILAGLWPAVRIAINHYNRAASDSKTALESAAERIEFAASATAESTESSARVSEILDGLHVQLNNVVEGYSLHTIESPNLPSVWALTFLASLSVTIAHLIYQSLAPQLVRQFTMREHIDAEVQRYTESPSDRKIAVAGYFIQHERNLKARSEDELKDIQASHTPAYVDPSPEDPKRQLRVGTAIMESGAQSEYLVSSKRGLAAAVTSGVFYLIGLSLIAFIMISQTIKVCSAAWGG